MTTIRQATDAVTSAVDTSRATDGDSALSMDEARAAIASVRATLPDLSSSRGRALLTRAVEQTITEHDLPTGEAALLRAAVRAPVGTGSTAAAREAAIADFERSLPAPLSDPQRQALDAALSSLSDRQLTRLRDSGLRLWPEAEGVPPDISDVGVTLPATAEAGYLPEARVLRFGSSMSPSRWRHELAHAIDDVGNERTRVRLDEMPVPERRRAIERLDGDAHRLQTDTSRDIAAAFDTFRGSHHWTVDARDRYSFDVSARPGYALTSPAEFYAEGFAAFHADEAHAERLRTNAPALYAILRNQAEGEGTLPPWARE